MVNNFNYSKLKQRLFGNNSSLLINLFQKSFQKIENIGNHQLNFDGVWKCDYKILECGHFLPIEKPKELNALIKNYLNSFK